MVKKQLINNEKMTNKEKTISNKISYMELIANKLKYNSNKQCINAFQVMSNPEILKIAYLMIKSKPGNMTEGATKETLDEIKGEWFDKISKELTENTYKPNPVRRVNIPKPNGKSRPLGISSPRDKIIQQALKLVLEAVLEPKFKDSSHGFRPGRGCHSALKSIRE